MHARIHTYTHTKLYIRSSSHFLPFDDVFRASRWKTPPSLAHAPSRTHPQP